MLSLHFPAPPCFPQAFLNLRDWPVLSLDLAFTRLGLIPGALLAFQTELQNVLSIIIQRPAQDRDVW